MVPEYNSAAFVDAGNAGKAMWVGMYFQLAGDIDLKGSEDTLSDPVTVANGIATLKIEGHIAALQKMLFGKSGTGTLSAGYSGTDNITAGTDTADITVAPKHLTYAAAKDKPQDGTTNVSVSLTPMNLVGEDGVTLTATGRVERVDVGEYDTVDLTGITLSGRDAKYYTVEGSKTDVELATPVKIGKAALRGTVTQSGTPVPDAAVTLQQGNEILATATTDADGNYAFPETAPGIYTAVIETPDNKPLTTLGHRIRRRASRRRTLPVNRKRKLRVGGAWRRDSRHGGGRLG